MGKLSAVGVRVLTKPGRYGDGDGLHLHVRGPDRRAWVLRFMRAGKSRDMGLGAYPAVSLAEARVRAHAARQVLAAGGDPVEARQAEATVQEQASDRTFRRAAEDLIADKEGGWRNPKHRRQWAATLEAYAYPEFGDWPVDKVNNDAVMRVLRPLWARVPETASRLRGRIEAVLDAARARGWRDGENPARWKGHLAARLPPARKVRAPEHYPSLPWQQLPAFLVALRERDGVAPLALKLAILTAARSGELRGMTWGEVDLDAAVWTVPARRMKAGKVHRVPLSTSAIALLRGMLPGRAGGSSFVFPGKRVGSALSDMTMTAVIRRMNEVGDGQPAPWRDPVQDAEITVHGFRSTFRVWAGECTPHPREVVEAALAHTVRDKAEAAYARTDLLERRRPLMEEWAAYCHGRAATAG